MAIRPTSLSLFDSDALLRQGGAERVGEDASRKLAEILEDSAQRIVVDAQRLARHAGRKRILREDILLAAQMIR
ncbi:NFYB/HAP3 family transcription factor subunit [Candidatus Micrarchaeota archaeon]|nr:NFYB/HAP3 family transcription factor subunit [Candidatus Micrarchaeota archaeon]